jgi:dethiobiotin synthetase
MTMYSSIPGEFVKKNAGAVTGIFVTATNTGAGKTVASAALLRLAARHGVRAVGLKPVASGAERSGPSGRLCNVDALELQAAASVSLPYAAVNPFCFEPAVAPHLAAREAGVPVTVESLVEWYQRTTAGATLAIVEGAGGWRVPLHPRGFLSDLPEQLGLGVILVVGLTLGCLNHARLTGEAIAASGRCPWLGWIGNEIDPDFERVDENLDTLSELLGTPPLAYVRATSGLRSPWGNPAVTLPDDPRLLRALRLVADQDDAGLRASADV